MGTLDEELLADSLSQTKACKVNGLMPVTSIDDENPARQWEGPVGGSSAGTRGALGRALAGGQGGVASVSTMFPSRGLHIAENHTLHRLHTVDYELTHCIWGRG